MTTVERLFLSLIIALGVSVLPACGQPQDRLQTLRDRAEIEELVTRYVIALDTLDADLYASVFTEDAVYEVPGAIHEGRAAIRKIVTDLQEARDRNQAQGISSAPLYHVMSNASIEIIDADEARHTSYAQTVRQGDDGRFVIGFMGRYQDEIVKRDGHWQIVARRLESFVQ